MLAGRWKRGAIPEKWDGKSSERIVAALEHLFSADRTVAAFSGRRARPTPGWP
jgi:UDP-N-acetylglucosamine 2-epimerase (non-hydrolysing)